MVLHDTFVEGFHRPPEETPRPIARILDLGSNIGLTVADLAACFPDARIVGVELDETNAALARANVKAYGNRCEILHHAVWWNDDDVGYDGTEGQEWAFRIQPNAPGRTVCGITIAQLIERIAPDGATIDYIKMDIEGAEREVLTRETGWCQRVRSMKVETHHPYTVECCIADLARLGFATRRDKARPECVVAVSSDDHPSA